MKRTTAFSVSLLACFTLGACASVGANGAKYTPPDNARKVQNKKEVDAPFDGVWDHLVELLSASFFVINNIDKESRLLNVSFSTNTPNDYIDCGTTDRTMSYERKTREYDYETATSSTYKRAFKWGPFNNLAAIETADRKTNLTGRINIYVAPLSKDKTTVSVNTRYIFTIEVSGIVEEYNGFGSIENTQRVPKNSFTISFNTDSVGRANGNGNSLQCVSRGVLEKKILRMASP